MKVASGLKFKSDVINSTLADVVSSLISGGFDAAHGRTTSKEAVMSALHYAVGGAEQAVEFDDSAPKSSRLGKISFKEIKQAIYAIIMAGVSGGLYNVEEAETPTAQEALTTARDAAFNKTREVLPEKFCDFMKLKIFSAIEKRRTEVSENYSDDTGYDASGYIFDSAEKIADKGLDGVRQIVSGETSVGELFETTLTDANNEFLDGVFDKAQYKTAEFFDATGAKIDEKSYKHKGSKKAAAFANDTARTLTAYGVDSFRGVASGDMSVGEALEATAKGSAGEISVKATGLLTSKVNEKIGLDLFEPGAVIETARKVKDCFKEYINGDINETQFFMEIGYDGLYQTAQAWGTAVGTNLALSVGLHGAAAAMTVAASSALVVAIYGELYNYAVQVFQEEAASEERMNNIRQLSEEAIEVIREERESLLANTFMTAEHRQKVFRESLNDLSAAVDNGDVELLTAALHKITEEVGGTIQFRSFEEFDDFMQDDSLALIF